MNTLVLLALPLLAGSPAVFGDAEERVVELVTRYRSDGDAQQAKRALAAVSPPPMQSVIHLLTGRELREGPTRLAPVSDPEERALLIDVARGWPERRFLELVMQDALPGADLTQRVHAIRLLGEVGRASTLDRWLEAIQGMHPTQRGHAGIARTLEDSLTSLLVRDRLTYPALARVASGLDDALLPTLARSLGHAGRGQGLPLLDRLLGKSLELDLEVLAALGDLHPWAPQCLDGRAAAIVRPFVDSIEPELRRRAALTLGRLGSAEAFGELLDLLGDRDARVQRAAHRALREISGLEWSNDLGRWENWHERELAWRELHADDLLTEAESADPAKAGAALRELSKHSLFGRGSAPRIARLLGHSNETIAVAACTSLARLGHAAAVAPLVRALTDERRRVRQAAGAALETWNTPTRRASIAPLGPRPTPAAWQAWIQEEIE